MSDPGALVTISRIEAMILFIRGQRVMLDADLAVEATSPEIRNTTYEIHRCWRRHVRPRRLGDRHRDPSHDPAPSRPSCNRPPDQTKKSGPGGGNKERKKVNRGFHLS